MVEVTCTYTFRNKNGGIVGYRIQDRNGEVRDIKKDVLKDLIKRHEIMVNNLTLTSDNRLVSKTNKQLKENKSTDELFVKISMCADIEPGEYTMLERSLLHNIDGFIDFNGNTEIKYASNVEVKPMNGNTSELISKIYISMTLCIEKEFLAEFKRFIDHHIEYLINMDDYTEIKSVYDCKILSWKKSN